MAGPEESYPAGHDWLDRLPLPAAIIRAGRFVYVNQAFLELTGLTREQALGMPFDQPVAPEHRARIRERHQLRLRGEAVPSSYGFDVVRADGARRSVEIFVTTAGADTLLQLQDVTERAERQRHLGALVGLGAAVQREQRDEAIFRAVDAGLNALGAAVAWLVPQGEGVRVASLAIPRVGPGVEAALPPGSLGAVRPWLPGTRLAWAEGFAFLDDLPLGATRFFGDGDPRGVRSAAGRWGRGAVVRIDVSGRPAWMLSVMAPWLRPEDQTTLALFGAQIGAALDAARVITDLSKRNAELAALNRVATVAGTAREQGVLFAGACQEVVAVLGAAAVALYLVEPEGTHARLAYVHGGSKEAAQALARVPLEGTHLGEAAREGRLRTFHRDDFEPGRRELMRRMGQAQVFSVPMLARNRAVGVMNVAFAESRALSPQEEELLMALAVHLAAAVETAELVEDLRESYADLFRTQEELVRRERLAALGVMAAAVAHEVRNPLGVIFNALVSLRRGLAAGQPPGPLLAILSEESERINHLVSDLLDFARPAQPELSPEVALRAAVEEAVGSVAATAQAPVTVAVRGGEGLRVAMDARLMRQVFVNLAENAVQAMPQGGALEVTLGAEGEGPAGLARVEFRDTGHGITPEALPRIFEPFFTTRARGTGLGLALVKRIVEGHRGEVRVQSEPGRGARFEVRWPSAG